MKNYLFILLFAITLSCQKESVLSDSVYIPDSDFSELPAYSEMGYNTFGANFDRKVYTYSYDEVPLKVTIKDSIITFIFQGQTTSGSYENNYMCVKFSFPYSNIVNYSDLLIYNNTSVNLTDESVLTEMLTETSQDSLNIIEGELFFKRSQKVFVDDEEVGIILSGLFEIKFITNDIPSSFSDGRFDFTIDNNNFYNLN